MKNYCNENNVLRKELILLKVRKKIGFNLLEWKGVTQRDEREKKMGEKMASAERWKKKDCRRGRTSEWMKWKEEEEEKK